ncbi:NAD(P)/FAD-dependent oxidoreductase [Tabrizicola sp.]|uniref:NAD(P)/FAD-dependent oxidoreductase n=1 Tax=Tabrizicola sp. TaxID=2005166 RepID=UPI0035B2647A
MNATVARNGDVSFWYAQMGGTPGYRPPLPGDRSVDVCIIGAGYTGLWTAWYLKTLQPDLSVAVVEREFAGFGASGRNGGWLTGGFSWSREKYLAGGGTREGVIAMGHALRGTVAEVMRVAEEQGIAADILPTDGLTVACTPAQLQRMRETYEEEIAWGTPKTRIEMIGGEEMRARIKVKDAMGALVTHGVARVQPAKLARGLAAAVERLGVQIWEQTTVTGMEKGRVHTDRGTVTAPVIVRATEGFTPGLPGQSRKILPLNSAIVVTEPVPETVWQQIGWNGYELLGDASHTYSYAQRTADNRIAMGGRGVPYRFGSKTDLRGQTQDATIDKLQGILRRLLPEAADLKLSHGWCGVLGVPRDWCASVGFDRKSGMAWAGGYVGLGVSTSNLSGQTLADLILGRDTGLVTLPWVNRKVREWEPEPFRWLGVHGMYQLYYRADAQEARSGGVRTSALAKLANKLTGR